MNIPASILFLSTLVEGTVEYFFGQSEFLRKYLKYIALVLGVGAAVAYQVDLLSSVGLHSVYPYVDYVVSGIIISRGSNIINDIVSRLRSDGTSS